MRTSRRLLTIAVTLVLPLGSQIPVAATAEPQTVVIRVDHADLANQVDPGFGASIPGRVFEYTDFFPRAANIHSGDTLTFRFSPGGFHVIALAKEEAVARAVYPVASNDTDDTDLAIGTGKPKLEFGVGNFSIMGGSVTGGGVIGGFTDFLPKCGITIIGQAPCTFTGPSDIESAGGLSGIDILNSPPPPSPPKLGDLDWSINVTAPQGTYAYFCYIHPGMRGTFQVVGNGDRTTTARQIKQASDAQFLADQQAALAAEAAANVVHFTGGGPGQRTYDVSVGISAADNHVAIDEMLPRANLHLQGGDTVLYHWPDAHNAHTVTFPTWSPALPGPFITDCTGGDFLFAPGVPGPNGHPPLCGEPGPFNIEFIADPGNAPPGSVLGTPADVVDSGVLLGTGYGLVPSAQMWSVVADNPGTFRYQCQLHDWMQGYLIVDGGGGGNQQNSRAATRPQQHSAGLNVHGAFQGRR